MLFLAPSIFALLLSLSFSPAADRQAASGSPAKGSAVISQAVEDAVAQDGDDPKAEHGRDGRCDGKSKPGTEAAPTSAT